MEHIEEICEIANGVMIARGDLGVEIPGMEVPAVQKYLISKCRMLGKRVITATEMLESMIHNPRPTRADFPMWQMRYTMDHPRSCCPGNQLPVNIR